MVPTTNSSPLWSSYSPDRVQRYSLFDVLANNPSIFGQKDMSFDPSTGWSSSDLGGTLARMRATQGNAGDQAAFVRSYAGDDPQKLFNDLNVSQTFNYDPASGMVDVYNDPAIEAENNAFGGWGSDWVGGAALIAAPFAGMMSGFTPGMAGAGAEAAAGGAFDMGGMAGLENGFGIGGAGMDMPWGVNPQTGVGMDDYFTNFANDIVDSSGNLLTGPEGGFDLFSGGSGGGLPSWLSSASNGAGSFLKSILGNSGGLSGAALGALLGGMGANQKPAGNITTTQDIPDYLKPYQSMNLTSGVQNFGLASQGQSLLPGAQQYMQNQIAGKYLDPNTNPAFQPYVKDLMGQVGSQFAARYGATPEALNNTGNQEGFTRAITAAALPLYNSAFQTAQGNQFNAAQNAPGFAGNVAGAALAPNLAFKNLYTGPQTNTTPYFTNPMAGALSGALAGGTLGSQLGRG